MTQPAEVLEKAPKPQGLLPKNVQSWLLIGLAFLMVVIMWLTGGKKPPTPTKSISAIAPVQVPLEVNETKINELQNRIEELQRQQLVAQSALAQQTRLLGVASQDSTQDQQQAAPSNPSEQRAEDPIQTERKRRSYVSLFASNVALTYRKTPPAAPAPEPATAPTGPSLVPVGPDAPQVAQLLKEIQPNPISDSVEFLSRAARLVGRRARRERGSDRWVRLRVQEPAQRAGFCDRSERHSKQTAKRSCVSSARFEWGPLLAVRTGYWARPAAGLVSNPATRRRANEFAGQEPTAPRVAGAAIPQSGSATR